MILFDCKNTKIILLFNDNVCFFLILTAKNGSSGIWSDRFLNESEFWHESCILTPLFIVKFQYFTIDYKMSYCKELNL